MLLCGLCALVEVAESSNPTGFPRKVGGEGGRRRDGECGRKRPAGTFGCCRKVQPQRSHPHPLIKRCRDCSSAPSLLLSLRGALVTVQPPCFPFGSAEFATKHWEISWIKYSSTGTLSTATSATRSSSRWVSKAPFRSCSQGDGWVRAQSPLVKGI